MYEVGDTVAYRPHGISDAVAQVVARVDNLTDGKAGFIGVIGDYNETRVWGFDSEVVEVLVRRHPDLLPATIDAAARQGAKEA